jgi:hypothetical protein
MKILLRYLKEFGALRVGLIVLVLFSLVFRPEPIIDPVYDGWNIVFHMLLPVFAPIQFMLLMLDALMAKVMMTDKTGAERQRYRRIVWTQLLLGLAFLAYWLPYYKAINA